MDGQSDRQLIAQERNTEITLAPAHLYYRSQLATAAAGTDENRIHQVINNAQFFINQSPNRERASTRDKVPGTMMTNLAIHGDGSQEMKLRCPVPYIAYVNAMKGDRPDDYEPREDKDKALFEDFDGTNLIWTDQKEVSKSLEVNNYLANSYVPGEHYPRMVSLESSTGSLKNGKWEQNVIGNKRLPLDLLKECFTEDVETRIKNRIREAGIGGHDEIKTFEAREELGAIGIICGTYFKTTRDLYQHCQSMHGISTVRLGRAVMVDEEQPTTPDPTPPPPVAAHPGFGLNRRTIYQWMESKSFAVAEKSDTLADVMNKFRNITNNLITEIGAINKRGIVEKNFWGDIMALIEKFLEKRTLAYEELRMTSLIQSSKEGIFSPSTEHPISVDDLHLWMQVSIERGEKHTIGKRLSAFMLDKIPMSSDIADQYDRCSKNVKQHLGTNTKFLLPAQLVPDGPVIPALVELSSFLTSIRMMKQWDLGNNKFWGKVKKEKLEEKLFCTTVTAGEAPTPQTIATAISELKTSLNEDPTYFKSLAGVNYATEADDETDTEEDIPEALIEDDLSPDESRTILDAINRAFIKATSPEVAVKMSGKTFRSKRLRSQQAFDKDSKTKQCSRIGCANRTSCYSTRRTKYQEKKYLYSQIPCSSRSPRSSGITLLAGTIYKIQSGDTTVRFLQEQQQKVLLQDDKQYLTLGTIQKGTKRHKLFMDQEPMKPTEKGIKVSALRISGFHVEEEKPKQGTSEIDVWAKGVMHETEQRAKAKRQEHNPPKVKPKVITYPKVNIVTVSPRDPQIPNPVDTYVATKKWLPKQDIQKYYHLHPDIYDQDSVQTTMDKRFPDGLPVVDLCPIPADIPEHVEEPPEFRDMSQDRREHLEANIKQSHAEMAVKASPDGQTNEISGPAYDRTILHGKERYEDLMLSDRKETYIDVGNSSISQRKDVEWILSDTPLSTIGKISQVALANKWSGHGTAMVDLKARTGTSRNTPCTVPLSDELCDCPDNAAHDIGRGRGNPRKICLGHNCWGLTLNVPLQEIDKGKIEEWINQYGCSLGKQCPKGFCVHIRGVANLDKENFLQLLDRVNDRSAAGEITLEDIQDLRPPDYMNHSTNLQRFRCTNDRNFTKPVDPDHCHQAVNNLWNLVKGIGQHPKKGTLISTKPPTTNDGTPRPHNGTPERPSPPPRSLLIKVSRDTRHHQLKVSRDTRHTDPGTTRTPRPIKTSRGHHHQSVKFQPPPTKVKMQCTDTPNKRRVILATGISLLLLITAGAATFGVITSNMHPAMDNETFTQVSGHKIQRRDISNTTSSDPNDVNNIILLAKERAATREEAQKKLNNGQTPIQIWVNDVASISFFTNLGGLEEDFNEAIELLEASFFGMKECLHVFNNTSLQSQARELCERTIAGIHSHIRSAMNPIEEAFWSLNSACATKLKHEDFLIKELEQIKQRLETEPAGPKITWTATAGQPTWPTRNKRAIGLITMAVIAAIGYAAAVPIALAMEDRAQQIQIDALHTTMNLHHNALKFMEGTMEPIEFINAVSASASHRLSNGVLLAEGVTDKISNFIDQQNGKFITTEKNTARAVVTASNHYYKNHSKPISDDPDKEYAIQRHNCVVVTRAESAKIDNTARSTCPEVTIIETVVCAMPYPESDKHNIIRHPYLPGAYIDIKSNEFTMHGWVIYSNPHHSFRTTSQTPMNGYIIQNMGRKILTRTGVSVSFLPARQVLADRIVIHTVGEFDLLYVQVTCHHGKEVQTGYITMFHNEDFTLGYNCDLKHKLIHVPRATTGVAVSYEDESLVERTKRHTNRFSILARNSNGENILGFLNDRIKNHHGMIDGWLPATGMPGIFRPQIGRTHWPTILSVCMAVLCTLIIAIILIRSRMLGRIWTGCLGPHACSDDSISSKTTQLTSIA